MNYGFNPPRGCSRRIPIEDFKRDWVRLPQREVVMKKDFLPAGGGIQPPRQLLATRLNGG